MFEQIQFDERGLVPCVAQDFASGEVLTLAYASEESLRLTLETGQLHFYSRSREEIWRKNATSLSDILSEMRSEDHGEKDSWVERALAQRPRDQVETAERRWRAVGEAVALELQQMVDARWARQAEPR